MISAEVICDSIGEHSPRLTTFLVVFPAFVEQELLRHRSFSFSSSSSRAVPVAKMLAEVRSDELRAAPVWWGREQKGMSSGDELSTEKYRISHEVQMSDGLTYFVKNQKAEAKLRWKKAALQAADEAEFLVACGAHKSIVNRILGPFIHRRIVITTCEPGLMNFFGLRLDRGAQAEIRVLAEQIWAAWKANEPRSLRPGEWHLPFIDDETRLKTAINIKLPDDIPEDTSPVNSLLVKVSAARCARTSYLSFETGKHSTVEEDLRLYEKLAGGSIIHASPMEHQATPDEINKLPVQIHWPETWVNPHLHGNLPGWVQHRKTIDNEDIAPLPEEYR